MDWMCIRLSALIMAGGFTDGLIPELRGAGNDVIESAWITFRFQ